MAKGSKAELVRMERALAAGGWRLVELMSPDERASVMLAVSSQLAGDDATTEEHGRVMAILMGVLLPEHCGASVRERPNVGLAIRIAATPAHVQQLLADIGGAAAERDA